VIAMKPHHDTEPDAQTIAIAALSYLATEPERLGRFLALTGLGPGSVREAARSPLFLAGVLDFILQEDEMVLAVADAQDVPPDAILAARHRLGGRPPLEDF
jgi:hypothetical protein